jgi:citrate lyase beta subunit
MRPVPRLRSLLFAPAVRSDFVERLGERGADAVVIDCEDATPANAKGEGRANAARLAPVLATAGVAVTVRVNSEPTEWFADDVREALSDALVAVVVPKVESLDGLDAVDRALVEAAVKADAVVCNMVLHHTPSPSAVLTDMAQLLHQGGTLIVSELCAHDQAWAREHCGDLWLGFSPEALEAWAVEAGLKTHASVFLAQRNGFQIQVQHFERC